MIPDGREGRDGLAVVSAALQAGAPVVQVRVKGRTDRMLYEFACRVDRLCARHAATCIVNDRLDIALAAGAAGTHLGADDLPVEAARRVAGSGHLIGGTARDSRRAAELVAAGAAYTRGGPAYATSRTSGLPAALGAAGLGAVPRAAGVPVIAIGGVTAGRIRELVAAGVHGVAVVSAVSDAADAGSATHELLQALDGRAP